MNEELKKIYNEGSDLFGYPQEYKKVKIYPIKIKDVKYQRLFYKLFTQPKNYIPNKEILKSSYLKFIVYVLQANINMDGSEMYDDLSDFLKYITQKNIAIEIKKEDGEGLSSVKLRIRIDEDVFWTEEDFDNVREIVLQQNGLSIEYIEEYNPELEESLIFMNKNSEDISFQDEIFTFCALMKLGLKDIEDYTIFQFKNLFEKVIVLKEYDLYKPLVASGQIELKSGEIKHYLYRSKKSGRYDSIKMDVESFVQGDLAKVSHT